MNYGRSILITLILLNVSHLHNEDTLLRSAQASDIQQLLTPNEIDALLQPSESSVTEKTTLDQWNNHLALLTFNDEYWDTNNNIPLDSTDWKTTAFKLAEQLVKEDNSLADTLKTDFFNAISAKIAEKKGILKKESAAYQLTQDFDQMITDALTPLPFPVIESSITAETAPTPFIMPEISAPLPILEEEPAPTNELLPVPSTESATTTSSETASAAPTSEQTPEDLQQKWQTQLNQIKQEGKDRWEFEGILNATYSVAQELLKAGNTTNTKLQKDFLDALQTRSVVSKKLYQPDMDETTWAFNNAVGISSPQPQYSYPQQMPFEQYPPQTFADSAELQELKTELAAKDAQLKEEQKKQAEDTKKQMIAQAAILKAQEEGKISQDRAHSSLQLLQNQQDVTKKKHDADIAAINEAHGILVENMEKLVARQKPAAAPAKGIIASITEPIYNWWYGTTPEKATEQAAHIPTEEEKQKFEKLLSIRMQKTPQPAKAEETFIEFQNLLVSFNAPDEVWITAMQDIVYKMVITYEVMSLSEVSGIINKALQASGRVSANNIRELIARIGEDVVKIQAAQEQAEAERQRRLQMKRDKKDAAMLRLQRIKDEEERVRAENEQRIKTAAQYKDEKKQWDDYLAHVARNKGATAHDNHNHTQEALKKSQSLMQLASNITNKNKTALSQKLKQKFSVALLEQQKNNDPEVNINIYRNMDMFNQGVNEMIE